MSIYSVIVERVAYYYRPRRELQDILERLSRSVDGERIESDEDSVIVRTDSKSQIAWSIEESERNKGYKIQEQYFIRLKDLLTIFLLEVFLLVISLAVAVAIQFSLTTADLNQILRPLVGVSPFFSDVTDVYMKLLRGLYVLLIFLLVYSFYLLYVVISKVEHESPLLADRHHSSGYEEYEFISWQTYSNIFLFVFWGIGIYVQDWRPVFFGTAIFGLSIVPYGIVVLFQRTPMYISVLKQLHPRWGIPRFGRKSIQISLYQVVVLLTLISTNYINIELAITPSRYFNPEMSTLILPIFDGALALSIFTLGYIMVNRYLGETRTEMVHGFAENPDFQPPKLISIMMIGGQVLLNIILVSGIILVWMPSILPYEVYTGGLTLSKTFATVFALYFPCGAIYQWFTHNQDASNLLARSEPYSIDVDVKFDYPVKRYETNQFYAKALSTRSSEAIILSDLSIELLNPDELAAIAAHEEAHLNHGDTRLLQRLRMIATFLLLGVNVLYEAVDFYEREIQADDHSSEKLGNAQLKSALKTIHQHQLDEKIEEIHRTNVATTGALMVPTQLTAPAKRWLDSLFDPFHSGVARKAHPNLRMRIQRLNE